MFLTQFPPEWFALFLCFAPDKKNNNHHSLLGNTKLITLQKPQSAPFFPSILSLAPYPNIPQSKARRERKIESKVAMSTRIPQGPSPGKTAVPQQSKGRQQQKHKHGPRRSAAARAQHSSSAPAMSRRSREANTGLADNSASPSKVGFGSRSARFTTAGAYPRGLRPGT